MLAQEIQRYRKDLGDVKGCEKERDIRILEVVEKENHCVTMKTIRTHFSIGVETVHIIIYEDLRASKFMYGCSKST